MRRALALLLALSLLGAAGLACAHRAVDASAEAVELRERVLFGDSAAAQGISVRVPVESGGRLFWDSELRTGAECTVSTDFRFTARRTYSLEQNHYHYYDGLTARLIANPGASGNFGTDFDNFDSGGFWRDKYFYRLYRDLLRDVASRTAAGEEHTERMELGDWLDFVPVEFDLDLPGWYYVFDDGETAVEETRSSAITVKTLLAEYFRIPLTDPCPVEVSVSKNPDGGIVRWQISAADGSLPGDAGTWDGLGFYALSAVTDDACYFVFEQPEEAAAKGRLDFSALPGGRGIYRLPFEHEGEDGYADRGTTVLYLNDIETVLPLAGGGHVELLGTDGERLLMLTSADGTLWLTQARLPDMTDVNKTALTALEGPGNGCERAVFDKGLCCVWTLDGQVLLLRSGDGGDYGLVLDVPAGPVEGEGSAGSYEGFSGWHYGVDFSYENYNTSLLWDGERLAVARWTRYWTDPDNCTGESGPILWVYDGTGLLYCGCFESSLCLPWTEEYKNEIHHAGDFELTWIQEEA